MGVWRFLVTNQPTWISNVSNFTSLTILGSLVAVYHRFTCDQPHCARFSHVAVRGTTYRTCRKHTNGEDHARLHHRHSVRHPDAHEHLNSPPRNEEDPGSHDGP